MGRVTYRGLLAVVALIAVVAVVGVVVLWPDGGGAPERAAPPAQTSRLLDATIVEVTDVAAADLPGLAPGAVTVAITARLDDSGDTVRFETIDDTGTVYEPGQRVRLAELSAPDQPTTYYVSDFQRGRELVVLAVLFVGVVLAFGRWQGLRALAGLGVTFLLIIGFMVPAIVDGRSPVAVAIVGSLAILLVTLYLSHGWSRKTTAAIVGTTGALLLTGALAWLFIEVANVTGFSSEEARLANMQVGGLSLRGLLLAGIIVGGLGVLDDVTMAQASTVFQLARSDPAAGFRRLLSGALVVGRDHVAATVNTLFLAYAGAALPLLLLFVTGDRSLGGVLTAEIVAVEVVRTLVGSIGLIAAVPLTTALAAALVTGDRAAAAAEGPGHAHAHAPPPRASRRPPPAASAHDEPAPPAHDDSAAPAHDEPAAAADDDDAEWLLRLRRSYGLAPDEADHDPGRPPPGVG